MGEAVSEKQIKDQGMALEAQRIFELLDEYNMSEYELSLRTGISHGTICGWKSQHKVPTTSSINKVCKALNITRADFYTKGVFATKPEDPKDQTRIEMRRYLNRIIANGDANVVLPILQKLSTRS